MGVTENDGLKKSRNFITQLEMLTDLCVFNPDRIVDFDVKKKKKNDFEAEDEEEDFLNITELC